MKNKSGLVDTISKGNYYAEIIQDRDYGNDSPRDWDNLGTMVCFHGRYNLGDYERKTPGKNGNCFSGPEHFVEWLKVNKDKIAVILPLYLYDHSGISMSTGRAYPYNDRWDSGQVGYIFVTKEDLKKEYSKKVVTGKMKENATRILQGEVETYDQFLTGDVYGYQIYRIDPTQFDAGFEFDPDEDDIDDYGESLESCWGFYGMSYVKEEINRMINWYQEKDKENLLKNIEADWNKLSAKELVMQES
jgi:hypothetical protein